VTNNGIGVAGVAPDAKVMPVRALGKDGGSTSDVVDGIVWAAGGHVPGVPRTATPARVINMSLGGSGDCSIAMQNAIDDALTRGTLTVVAAGNDGGNVDGHAACGGRGGADVREEPVAHAATGEQDPAAVGAAVPGAL
jgi:serine protease